MGAKCALPSVLSLLTAPSTGLTFPVGKVPSELIAKQLTLSTMAIAVGKLILGPVIDYYGGVFSLKVALLALAAALGIISVSQSFQVFAVAWICVDFIFSSCWAACIHAIHQTFPSQQWATQIGYLAAAARTGNALAFTLFAWVLHLTQPLTRQAWRPVFGLAAILQFVPVCLLTFFGNAQQTETIHAVERPTLAESLKTVRQELTKLDFWLQLINRSALMIFASFLLFIPTLMTHVYGTTPAVASQVGSLFALGCLLSVTSGSAVYPTLPWTGKLKMTTALLGTGILSSVGQLGHVSGWWELNATISSTLIFLWGLAVAIPFYLPSSLYALAKGRSSATIADMFDIGSFSLLAFFNGYVASLRHSDPAAWVGTFQLTTMCAVTSLCSLSFTYWREGQKQKDKGRTE
jgi:MFS family permease